MDALWQVRAAGRNQAVFVQGPGGVGKTFFIRELPYEMTDGHFQWLGPYDLDDPELWLLSNLQRYLIAALDPAYTFFQPFIEHQQQRPAVRRHQLGVDAVLAYDRLGEPIFRQCYQRLVDATQTTPVIILDNLDALQGLDFQDRLVRWMKQLPLTAFILASRPAASASSIEEALRAEPAMPCVELTVQRFSRDESRDFVIKSTISEGLNTEQVDALAQLSQGYPLWIVLSLQYLSEHGLPSELEEWWSCSPTEQEFLRDTYMRRLLVPYRGQDFWSETIKRLAVIRTDITRSAWQALMADYSLPSDYQSWEDAWHVMLTFPWIRIRSGSRNRVRLHDAVAEGMAQRLIVLDDADKSWRRNLWKRAGQLYTDLADQSAIALHAHGAANDKASMDSASVATQSLQHSRLVAVAFQYRVLGDREPGLSSFIDLYDRAKAEGDISQIQLLWLEWWARQPT